MKVLFLPQKIQQLRYEEKSCVLLEEGAEYDTMYDDRTSIYVKLNDISISKNKAELPEFDTFEELG